MNRRQFLTRSGAVAGVVSLSGCTSPFEGMPTPTPDSSQGSSSTETPEPSPEPYGTTIDIVDAGGDPSGERSVVPLLETHAGDDTLLYFPPGRYLMDDTLTVSEFSKLAFVGENATIVPPDGYTSVLFNLGKPGRATDLRFEGFEFDIRVPETGPRPLSVLAGGTVIIRGVAVTGIQDDGWGMLRVDVTDPDGVGLVERLSLPDGATIETGSTGCLVGNQHRGTIMFRDCHIVGFADNGLYAEPKQGSVRVFGGYYANSNVASLRVGNDAIVRGAHVRCDAEPPGFGNMRGIRLREGEGVLVEDCLVELIDVVGSDGAIVLSPWLKSATVRNTTVIVDADEVPAVLVKDPRIEGQHDGPVRLEGIKIRGRASGGAAIRIVERANCEIQSVDIRQSGPNREGIRFENSTAEVRDSLVDVTGSPVSVYKSNVEFSNNSFPSTHEPYKILDHEERQSND